MSVECFRPHRFREASLSLLASLRPNFFGGSNLTYWLNGIILKSRRRLLSTLQLHAQEIECRPLQGGGAGDLVEAVSFGQFVGASWSTMRGAPGRRSRPSGGRDAPPR
jgi:hypothetical protein